jgi:hypothetical protein
MVLFTFVLMYCSCTVDVLLMYCCIVVPAGTALPFYCNSFFYVYLQMFIEAVVFMIHGQGQRPKISVFTRLPRSRAAFSTRFSIHGDQRLRGPSVDSGFFVFHLKSYAALRSEFSHSSRIFELAVSEPRRPRFIQLVRRQRWSLTSLLSLVCIHSLHSKV